MAYFNTTDESNQNDYDLDLLEKGLYYRSISYNSPRSERYFINPEDQQLDVVPHNEPLFSEWICDIPKTFFAVGQWDWWTGYRFFETDLQSYRMI